MKRLSIVLEAGEHVDPIELEDLTRGLRARVLELEVERADLATSGPPPDGAKGAEAAAAAAISVTMLPIVLRSVVAVIETWLENRPIRSAKLTIGDDSIELTQATDLERRLLIDRFLTRQDRADAQ